MDDQRFSNGWLRLQNYEVLEPVLSDAMRARTTREWVEELEQVGIPCGPVNTVAQVADDPQIAARDMIIDVHHPGEGGFKVVNTPFKFSRTPYNVERASPDLGEHTQDILTQLLGMTRDEISELRRLNVI